MSNEQHILSGQVLVNDVDIWESYGVFLTEEKKGALENLTSIMTASKVKGHVGVDIREHPGRKYSSRLDVVNDEREVTLHFAQYAPTRLEWFRNYMDFIGFLKSGDDGWLRFTFPGLGVTLRMFFVECVGYRPLTYLWREGVQASRYKIRFREPEPII